MRGYCLHAETSSLRRGMSAIAFPGRRATKLEAFAMKGGRPVAMNIGKVMKVLPPAMALMTPPTMPVTKSKIRIGSEGISKTGMARKNEQDGLEDCSARYGNVSKNILSKVRNVIL